MRPSLTTPADLIKRVEEQPTLLLLLDGGLESDLASIIAANDWRTWHSWVYAQTEYAAHQSAGPLLVQARQGSPLLSVMVEQWAPLHWGGVLLSAQPFDQVLVHLRTLRHATLPDGQQSLFRLHEPRTLRGIVEGMDRPSLDAMLGPIDTWYWCEWNEGQGDWYGIDHASPGQGRPATQPLALTPGVLHAVDAQRTDYRNRGLMRYLRQASIPVIDDLDEAYLRQAVDIQANHAISLGFTSDDDLRAFIDLYFRHHARLFEPNSAITAWLYTTDLPAWRRLMHIQSLLEGTTA